MNAEPSVLAAKGVAASRIAPLAIQARRGFDEDKEVTPRQQRLSPWM
jgi:hypothetical protein